MKRLPKAGADIFHIVDGSQALLARWLSHSISLATSHDLIPLLQMMGKFGNGPPRLSGRWVIRHSIKGLHTVRHVISDSYSTAEDLHIIANVDPFKISVIHPAVPPEIASKANSFPILPWSDRRKSQKAYVLHIGNNAFYKNQVGVLRIFAHILDACDVRLRMVVTSHVSMLKQMVNDLGISDRVTFVVNPDDEELAALYRHASLFLFPSLYEGFGWPPLEAMAFGCPVVCSSAASLPEVVGDAALTCRPEDEKQMAENCVRVLQDASVANHLIELGYEQIKKFSVELMGRQLMGVYERLLNGG
jgi:glycosyltransferase involved in cell wall biosynthesis